MNETKDIMKKWLTLEEEYPSILKKEVEIKEETLSNLKNELNIDLPFSYVYYLKNYKNSLIDEESLLTIDQSIVETKKQRRNGLPHDFLIISIWDEGFVCIQCNQKNNLSPVYDVQYGIDKSKPNKMEYYDFVWFAEELLEHFSGEIPENIYLKKFLKLIKSFLDKKISAKKYVDKFSEMYYDETNNALRTSDSNLISKLWLGMDAYEPKKEIWRTDPEHYMNEPQLKNFLEIYHQKIIEVLRSK